MLSDVMEQVRTRAVAAAVGAALALSGLGASGALNAPLRMISEDSAPTEECVVADPATDDTTPVDETVGETDPAIEGTTEDAAADDVVSGGETPADEGCEAVDDPAGGTDDTTGDTTDDTTGDTTDDTTGDGTEDVVEGEDEGAVDPADTGELPAAPVTVSEAAHIHDFDEACGNHGAYVSHFARFGEEPECATSARGEAGQDDVSGEVEPPADDEAITEAPEAEGSSTSAVEPRGRGKGRGAQATAAKGARGKSGK